MQRTDGRPHRLAESSVDSFPADPHRVGFFILKDIVPILRLEATLLYEQP